MKLSHYSKLAAVVLVSTALTACGGGGGGGGSVGGGGGCTVGCGGTGGGGGGGTYYPSHAEVAEDFVDNAWYDANIDLELVKVHTLQTDYIVVFDHDYGTYDAYDIGLYNLGDDALDYINDMEDYFYYDLIPMGNGTYKDAYTGLLFEETGSTSKDLQKIAALKEELQIKKASKHIAAKFGLSADRSNEVARLAAQMAKAPKASMTDADYDAFAQELLGATLTQVKSAVNKATAGNSADLNALMEQAAEVNGVGPEQMNKIVSALFQ